MVKITTNIGWETAILKVFENNNGIATLQDLYLHVPKSIGKSLSLDFKHTIRAYLRRLKTKKKSVKQIGLATYALNDIEYENHFFEEIQDKVISDYDFSCIPKNKLHGLTEGMLVEIGLFNEFETYTPDKNIIFNGKRLYELVSYQSIPSFTYPNILKKVGLIDVIWFKDGFPIRTFDIENSTDFTKAFLRAYQLRFFNTKFFMIAEENKKKIYDDRKETKPFDALKNNLSFVSFNDIFTFYKDSVNHNRIKSKII